MEASGLPSSADEINLAEQEQVIRALQCTWQQQRTGVAAQFIETHISWVLIAGDDVYKFKKVLNTGFLDYSTLGQRLHCCEEELRLNRRLAPDLYLEVVALTGSPAAPVLGGTGAVIDYAVHMRAFNQRNLWSALASRAALTKTHIDELVQLLERFHAHAAVATAGGRHGTPAQVRTVTLDNMAALDALLTEDGDRGCLREVREWEARAWSGLEPVLMARQAQRRVRECHGDLHLGNITLVDGRVTVFDGIEFNDALRWIDVMGELAFVAMDLHVHGLPSLAHRCVNGYLEASGDYSGVKVLDHYLVHTALVRAKVAALRTGYAGTVSRYLELALKFTQARHPALMITHGYSGSGKTTLTQDLVETVGAIRIRADIERKRLAGLPPLMHTSGEVRSALYEDEMTAATYARLRELAEPVLKSGCHVILDATFLSRSQRHDARLLAEALGVSFYILHFDAAPSVLRERVRQRLLRGDDASEADEDVLALQERTAEPLRADELGDVFDCAQWPALIEHLSGYIAPAA
jgi:aminoglycoside phosphotransferase family enzyme/predicted kinase